MGLGEGNILGMFGKSKNEENGFSFSSLNEKLHLKSFPTWGKRFRPRLFFIKFSLASWNSRFDLFPWNFFLREKNGTFIEVAKYAIMVPTWMHADDGAWVGLIGYFSQSNLIYPFVRHFKIPSPLEKKWFFFKNLAYCISLSPCSGDESNLPHTHLYKIALTEVYLSSYRYSWIDNVKTPN